MEKSENRFDQDIKSLLDSHQPDVTPQWDHMQSQLDEAYEDEIFDEKIRKVLNNAQVYNEQMSWEALDQKLKMQAERKKKIISARLIESTLFILFLWTLDNIGIGNFFQESIQVHQQPMALESSEKSEQYAKLNPSQTSQKSYGLIPTVHSTPSDFKTRTNINTKETQKTLRSVTSTETKKQVLLESASSNSYALHSDNPSEKNTKSFNEATLTPKVLPAISQLNPENTDQNFLNNLSPLHSTLRIPEEIKMPLVAEGIDNLSKPEINAVELANQIKPHHTLYSKSIGVFAGAMVNIIQSPSFIQPDVNYTQAKLAHQAGLKFDFHHGDWTIRTGIAYQHIKYQPNFSETMGSFEGGYFKIHFKELEAHLVTLPIALSKTIISKENWELSVHMGLSLTASLQNNYRLDTFTDLSHNNVQNINFNPTSSSEIISRVRNASNKGLLEGGNIGTNSYASLIGGVRYQRKINPSLSYFGELEVSKMLGQIGFGPNSDKFIILGLNTGLAYRFGGI